MRTLKYGTRYWVLLACGLVTLALVLPSPQAAAFFKTKEPQNKPAESVNRQQYPLMVFERGVLQGDIGGGWMLGNTTLVLTDDSRVSNGNGPGIGLESGSEAVVMGFWSGDALVVYHASVISSRQSMAEGRFYEERSEELPKLAPRGLPQ